MHTILLSPEMFLSLCCSFVVWSVYVIVMAVSFFVFLFVFLAAFSLSRFCLACFVLVFSLFFTSII